MARSTAVLGVCFGVDTDTRLTPASIRQLAGARYQKSPLRAIGRYVSLSQPSPLDVTAGELGAILEAGFGSWPILHAHRVGWMPSEQLGTIDGQWAARNAIAAGYEPMTHLELDLEGVGATASRSQIDDWVGAAAVAIAKTGGFPVVLYVGWREGLGPEELWELPTVHLYASDGAIRKVAHRGTAAEQVAMNVVLSGTGTLVDVDSFHPDLLGGEYRFTVAV